MNNNQTQFLSTREAITEWLDKYNIKNYTINDDLSVDINGNINLSNRKLKTIPVKFGSVLGSFYCDNNKLTNLSGSPQIVKYDFVCIHNKLTNLIGSPKSVGGDFYCSNNQLTSLIGSPKILKNGGFYCPRNQLINLAGSPKSISGNFFCDDNKLTSLLEIINCNFKEKIYFNIDENNFQPKELIQILKQYYDNKHHHYVLTYNEFQDLIKFVFQKKVLQKKLNKVKINTKNKNIFI